MNNESGSQPEYRLIQCNNGSKPCAQHVTEQMVDLYNSPIWEMEVVATDKIQFTCSMCDATRVYKIIQEKTLLNAGKN